MQTMTSMCEIWWKQVGGSLRLVQAVVEHLQQEESLVLRTPKHIPGHIKCARSVNRYCRSIFRFSLRSTANSL